MNKKRTKTALIIIFASALLAGFFDYPKAFNSGVDFLNEKIGFRFPHFWEKPFSLGLDLQGGTHLVYEADLSNKEKEDYGSAMKGLRDIIERRVNLFGAREPVVQTEETAGHHRLVVEMPGVKDPSEAIKAIGQTPFLEFKEPREEAETEEILSIQEKIQEKGQEGMKEVENWEKGLQDPYFKSTDLTGQYLKGAEVGFGQTAQTPMILLNFNKEGAELFEKLTERNIGKPLAIYIDGSMISSPVVQDTISGGEAQITGDFAVQEAQELARNLNAGALPVPINLISQQSVGPTLGSVSLEKSLVAGVLGFLAIILFMIIFYRLPGLISGVSLIVYVALALSLFKLIPITLTLAGIGGFILSIGMAVDANVLIFSRLREEVKGGKELPVAVIEGFRRSWPSIRDGNLTTLIVALILFGFGTSFIKGFALTLSIGILLSIITAVFVSRGVLVILADTRLKNIKWIWK